MTAAVVPIRKLPPLHFSQLKAMASCPMRYAHELMNGRAETKPLRLGSALDALLYGTCDVAGFDGQRRGKEWQAFAEANVGAILLNRAESDLVRGMHEAIQRRPDALGLLTDGTAQETIRWSVAGRECEGTPDVFTDSRIVELKTCRSAHPERFRWDAIRLGYMAQLAWYREGLALSGRANPSSAYIVAVESIAPHPVTVFELTDRAMDQGARTWRLWFEQLRTCEDSNEWPPYVLGSVPLDVPENDDGFSLRIGGEEVEIE